MNVTDALATFVERVADDESLRSRLGAIRDHTTFATACVAAGRENGLDFAEADVRALLQSRHLYWLQRHIA